MHLRLQRVILLAQHANMLNRTIQNLTLARLHPFLASIALSIPNPAIRQRGNGLPQFVEVRVEVLAVASLDGCVGDALTFARAGLDV
jgi:hypothetical protein